MLFIRARAMSVLFTCLVFSASAGTRNHVVTLKGGELHLRGALAEGACEVSAESQDMHVDMGQYRNDVFRETGTLSHVLVPFDIHLTGCNPAVTGLVGVSFSGMTDPKDPDVFRVSSGDRAPIGVSGRDGYSGLGLLIADEAGSQVIPGRVSDTFVPVTASDVVLHFTARYRATSQEPSPGALSSDVSFSLVYP